MKLYSLYILAGAIVLVALALALITFFPSKEPTFDEYGRGHEAFNMGEYSRARQIVEPLAVKGDRRSQQLMAIIEAFGLGRPINREEAKDWIARSSAQERRGVSECYTGLNWATGQFGNVDLDEAIYWISYSDYLSGVPFCVQELGERLPETLRSN